MITHLTIKDPAFAFRASDPNTANTKVVEVRVHIDLRVMTAPSDPDIASKRVQLIVLRR